MSEQEWTLCTVHRVAVRDGSCSACGGDRHLVQVVPVENARDANRYHQSLGAKWMCEAIIREQRTKFRENRNAQEFADDLERRWEDEDFWRPKQESHERGCVLDELVKMKAELAVERARCEALLHAVQAHNGNPLELIDDDIAEATLAIREAIKVRSSVTPSPPERQPK